MTLDTICKAIGDLARPLSLLGVWAAIILALALGRDVSIVGTLCAALTAMYLGKAAESAVVGQAQAKASGGAQP